MSSKIQTSQLNIKIDSILLGKAKATAFLSGDTLKGWIAEAIQEKLQRNKVSSSDQATELREIMKERNQE